jgi:hypothetical protein
MITDRSHTYQIELQRLLNNAFNILENLEHAKVLNNLDKDLKEDINTFKQEFLQTI